MSLLEGRLTFWLLSAISKKLLYIEVVTYWSLLGVHSPFGLNFYAMFLLVTLMHFFSFWSATSKDRPVHITSYIYIKETLYLTRLYPCRTSYLNNTLQIGLIMFVSVVSFLYKFKTVRAAFNSDLYALRFQLKSLGNRSLSAAEMDDMEVCG